MDISRLADKLRSQNFGANDSVILSAINHPLTAAQKGADWFAGQVNRAANIPEQYDNPNPLAGYTPEQQVGGALNLAGLAMTGPAPFGPKGSGGTLGAIPVSHGSPHGPFKEFDLSELGTGAGAQAYGHGIYFGEGYNSPVAMRYVPRNEKLENKLQDLYDIAEKRNQYPSMEVYEQYMLNKAPEDVEKYLTEVLPDYSKSEQMAMKQANELAKKAYQGQKGSYLYNADLKWTDPAKEAEMPMSKEHFLHWDKPLSEQSDYVKNALLDSKIKGDLGYDIYSSLGGGEEASNYLNSIGIPGMRYFEPDAGTGSNVENLIAFDPKIADILSINSKKIANKLRGK
jgi:hypothetical protein